VRALEERVEVRVSPGGDGLLCGAFDVELRLPDGSARRTSVELPPGAPGRPATPEELRGKLVACAGEQAPQLEAQTWDSASRYLREVLDRADRAAAPAGIP
jgi:hypothetical protein